MFSFDMKQEEKLWCEKEIANEDISRIERITSLKNQILFHAIKDEFAEIRKLTLALMLKRNNK